MSLSSRSVGKKRCQEIWDSRGGGFGRLPLIEQSSSKMAAIVASQTWQKAMDTSEAEQSIDDDDRPLNINIINATMAAILDADCSINGSC